jgi:hypothetical protein
VDKDFWRKIIKVTPPSPNTTSPGRVQDASPTGDAAAGWWTKCSGVVAFYFAAVWTYEAQEIRLYEERLLLGFYSARSRRPPIIVMITSMDPLTWVLDKPKRVFTPTLSACEAHEL